MEVFVVLTWDHDDLVGVAKDRFAVAKIIAEYIPCKPSEVTLGASTAQARLRAETFWQTHKFHLYREEVQVMRPTLDDSASWEETFKTIDNLGGKDGPDSAVLGPAG